MSKASLDRDEDRWRSRRYTVLDRRRLWKRRVKEKMEAEAEVARERKLCVMVALVSLRDPSEGVLVVVLIIGIDFVVASLALDDSDVVSSTAELV